MKQFNSVEYQREYKKKNPQKVKKWREDYYLRKYFKILKEQKNDITTDKTS